MLTGNELMQPVLLQNVPQSNGGFGQEIEGGLTIRQYFAAMAMQGILSNTTFTDLVMKTVSIGKQASFLSQAATEQADALIEELNKQK